MQNRKIAVPIKTIDEKHCSMKCDMLHKTWTKPYCLIKGYAIRKDKIGYHRTAECREREIKEGMMNNDDKRLIFDYCGWCQHDWIEAFIDPQDGGEIYSGYICFKCKRPFIAKELDHPLDGNDILEAVGIMESKGDWLKFLSYTAANKFDYERLYHSDIPYLIQNFFPLMAAWLKRNKC